MNERTTIVRDKVKLLRLEAQELNNRFPQVLSDLEKYNLAAANRCRSIKYLTEVLNKFKEQIKDDK